MAFVTRNYHRNGNSSISHAPGPPVVPGYFSLHWLRLAIRPVRVWRVNKNGSAWDLTLDPLPCHAVPAYLSWTRDPLHIECVSPDTWFAVKTMAQGPGHGVFKSNLNKDFPTIKNPH
jgi:hypothetical protein